MTLKITNLSKRLDNNWIIRDVSLEVKRGEILGLFSGSGTGKSMLLRMIAGMEPSDGGTVFFDSNDLSSKARDGRDFVFAGVNNDSSWKSIFTGKTKEDASGAAAQERDLNSALESAEGVLLIDNQFRLMDKQTRERAIGDLKRTVREKNLAVVFATNDFEEIFLVCDHVAVLVNGEVAQSGTPREVYERPLTSGAASIIGSNNLIAARRLTSSKSEISEFQTIDGDHRLFTDHVEKSALGAIDQNHYLAIRPEHISISFGASFPEDNLLKAEISEIIYQGATTLIRLNANGLMLDALVLRLVGLNVGDECMVGLPPDRILVLKD